MPSSGTHTGNVNIIRHFAVPYPDPDGQHAHAHAHDHDHDHSGGSENDMERGEREVEVWFTLSAVDYVFELRVPRLQIVASSSLRGGEKDREREMSGEDKYKDKDKDRDGGGEILKKELRREIERWWEGVADHMNKLVCSSSFGGVNEIKRLFCFWVLLGENS